MQKKKNVDNDIVKLKLFPFSLRDRAKTWFSSLPKNSIVSWNKCKVICLPRIYNFLLFHAIILSVLDVLYALISYFI